MNQSLFPTPDPDLYTEAEISKLVHEFYSKARKDPSLGPIFEAHVIDWDAHFIQMINFWSAQLRGTSRFRGAPICPSISLCRICPPSCFFVGWRSSNKPRANWEIQPWSSTPMQSQHLLQTGSGKVIKWVTIRIDNRKHYKPPDWPISQLGK